MASTKVFGKESSNLLQKILDTTQTMIFWKDAQRRFVGVNQAFLDYYGFAGPEVLLGKTDEEMGWHSDPGPFEDDEWQVLRQGKSFSMVHGKCLARGEEREIMASKSPLYEQGKIVGLVGSFIDVTEQYRQRDEIATLPRKLDGIPGGIAIFKRHYEELLCISVNHCLEKLLGVPAYQLVGKSVREIGTAFVFSQDRERWVWENMLLHGQTKSVSGTYRFHNQARDIYVWLHVDCHLVREPGDEELVYCTYTNVDRLMQDEAELQDTRHQEEERYARALELLRQEQEENIVAKGHYNFTKNQVLEYTAFLNQVYTTRRGTTFDDAFAGFMSLSYTAADRQELAATMNREHILESFARGETHLKVSYRRLLNGVEPIWLLLVMQTFKTPATGDVEGFSYTYNITEKVLKENIVDKLGGLGYDELGIVYLQNGFWRCYQFGNYLQRGHRRMVTNKGPWDVELARYILEDVVPEQQRRVQEKLSLPAIIKQLTQQDVFTFTNSVRLPDGSLRQEQLQFSYQDAETLFYCMSDITVQFTHENAQLAELAAAKMAADKANQYKSNFLSSMSHDLRTPLNGIIGFTNLALQTEDVKKKQDFLQKIKSSGELLEDLVNDTLELSRIESGKQVLEPATVVEKDFWDGVVTAMIPSAQMKNLQLQTEYVALQDELISLDKVKAKKILLNLISNAIKYTPQGGRIKVSVKALEPPEHGCSRRLVVEDTGIGMSPEFLERMYEPFSQEHRPEARNVTGTGLGLAIVKMNVDLMGGTIQAVSKVGHGTRFTVDLPVEHWTRAAVAAPASAQKPELDWRRLAGCKVLVCEDNYLNAEIATLLLKDKQMEVDWAQDGQQGLEKFRDSLPGYYDLILMDIRMPVLDGYKATRAIRKLARPDAATVPIVAMTANAFEEDLQEAEAAGMNAYITKPVNPQHLYQTLLEVKKG